MLSDFFLCVGGPVPPRPPNCERAARLRRTALSQFMRVSALGRRVGGAFSTSHFPRLFLLDFVFQAVNGDLFWLDSGFQAVNGDFGRWGVRKIERQTKPFPS